MFCRPWPFPSPCSPVLAHQSRAACCLCRFPCRPQAYKNMCSHGCVPDGILYNSLLDLLWDTGIPWVQSVAGTLLRRAVHEGHMHAPLAPVSSTPLEAEALLLLLLQMQPKRKAHPLAGKGDWQSAGWQQRQQHHHHPDDSAL